MTEDKKGEWQPIETAPKDGTTIIARGWDWGRVGNRRHVMQVVRDVERDEWRNVYDLDETAAYLTDWFCATPPQEA